MQRTNRIIARRLLLSLLAAALLVALLVPAMGSAAPARAQKIKGAWSEAFPEEIHGTSVAIAPDGDAWFGISTGEKGEQLAHAHAGKLEVEALGKEATGYATTNAVQFASDGSLWFISQGEAQAAIARRDPSGTVTESPLPKGEPVNAMTFGPEGNVWFVRGGYGNETGAAVGRMTSTGEVTEFPLEAGSRPTSITSGPDGSLWFTEELKGKIGRITTGGEIQLFDLESGAQPHQIVAGPDGALWFTENALARLYGKVSNRIGRITPAGQVTQFPVPFGKGTSRLAPDPAHGVVWFATTEGEFSSVSPSGNVGARGCVGSCGDPVEGMTLGPDGSLWFAAANKFCEACGGGSDLLLAREGTPVGRIPGGTLAPADLNGPPAVDPLANQTHHPPPPIVRTDKPEELEATFVELSGYINSRGYPTTWRFKWGKTKKYGHRTFFPEYPIEAEQGAAQVGEEIYGLCPATTYHYEIIAWGPGGRVSGGDRVFRTPRQKHIPAHCRAH